MKPTVIYVDVDETLADWVGPALRLLGHDPESVYARWNTLNPRPWDVFDVVPRPPSIDNVTDAIDVAGAAFWADIPMFSWARELIVVCETYAPVVLLTSPSKHASSHAGKAQWIAKHFGRDFRDYLIGSCKHYCAHPRAVLIDDSPKNCDRFREHEGRAILFPGVVNELHYIPGYERVAYVRDQLERIVQS